LDAGRSPPDLIEASPSMIDRLVKRHLARGLSTDGRSIRSGKGFPRFRSITPAFDM